MMYGIYGRGGWNWYPQYYWRWGRSYMMGLLLARFRCLYRKSPTWSPPLLNPSTIRYAEFVIPLIHSIWNSENMSWVPEFPKGFVLPTNRPTNLLASSKCRGDGISARVFFKKLRCASRIPRLDPHFPRWDDASGWPHACGVWRWEPSVSSFSSSYVCVWPLNGFH